MKRLLVISLASASVAIGAIPVLAEVDPKIHKLCIEAKDYSGCVRSMKGESSSSDAVATEKCWGSGLSRKCLAKDGLDQFGMPKIVDWIYENEANGGLTYREADIEKINKTNDWKFKFVFIPHKGQKRYWGIRTVARWRYNATAGTPSSSTTIGNASTSCTSYGSTASCSTTPAPTINLPGTAPKPGGIASQSGVTVFDCKDKTAGMYLNGKSIKKWQKNKWVPNCSDVPFDEFEVLNYKL